MTIIDREGRETAARVTGKVYRETPPVTGDRGLAVNAGDGPVVESILPRSGILQRTSPLGRTTQVIAANVDAVLVICSLKSPDFSHGFLTRALAAAEWHQLDAVVVLNKLDLSRTAEDERLVDSISSIYGKKGSGYSVFPVSCETGFGTDELLAHIRGSTVVMTGQSGAGKTSLARRFIPSLDMRIGAVNPKTTKGRHTTVAARLIPLDPETAIIDTPGLRMFSIEHIPREKLQLCFPEFEEYIGECRFRDCLHLTEPGCAVKSAVERGDTSLLRYDMYREHMEAGGD
ncbi:MAG: ribosome small subunit-dependent GTPase A [Candidatus Aegiribacteria sp.]